MSLDLENLGEQLSNLEFENIGNWPLIIRASMIVVICAAVLGLGYYFDTMPQQDELNRVASEEAGLWSTFETKQQKAVLLESYKRQMKEMEESFGTMLRQLPSRNEVAELLVDITQTGLASGLSFELFKPEKESPKEFYAELPIKVKVGGDYHSMGEFAGGIAALPRIVTIHDVTLRVSDKNTRRLSMEAVAKTYRYLDEEEIVAAAAAKKKDKRRGRK
ncbi:MAG: type 4a pilus biogenesis protein PilO [Chromatiales bacterium]|nr:type 4a pilus biogenesis protein PilO [Chromatiales bacterium]